MVALTVCSTAFTGLGHAQAKALGYPDLPIAVVPHPFGIRSREEISQIAAKCVAEIARLVCESKPDEAADVIDHAPSGVRANLVDAPGEPEEMNRFFHERHWGDGLPVLAPTVERVSRMLMHTHRAPEEVVARIAPAFGAATVESIAINGVLAGCRPEYLPVLIAAAEAVAFPKFNLQGIQATTNPAAVWLVLNGPIARQLGVNSGGNCLGPGTWANATLGRALRLVLQNIGGALPGDMDRATHGQPGKYTFCCAENEAANPWEPLHVERGFDAAQSTVTVVGPLGTWNMNTHAKDSSDLLRVVGDTMAFPASSDYVYGGEPWLVLSPEHAHILQREGLTKSDVKSRLWDLSKIAASRFSAKDFARVQTGRHAELGQISAEDLLPIAVRPDDISIIVAGGPGTHSVYMPISGHSRSVTREVVLPQ